MHTISLQRINDRWECFSAINQASSSQDWPPYLMAHGSCCDCQGKLKFRLYNVSLSFDILALFDIYLSEVLRTWSVLDDIIFLRTSKVMYRYGQIPVKLKLQNPPPGNPPGI